MKTNADKDVSWFLTASGVDLFQEVNRVHRVMQNTVPGSNSRARYAALMEISKERQLIRLKECAIANLLDRADANTKVRVTPLLMQLDLQVLVKANPYAGNDSDDCHTYS